jgi:glucose-6-phosphate isomerase
MTEKSKAPEKLGAWKSLRAHQKEVSKKSLRELFAKSRNRADRFSAEACGIRLDYSRHLATRKTVRLLTRLAREAGVGDLRDRMFAGEHINTTEDRAVLHVALRAGRRDRFRDGDQDCTADVHEVLDRMERFVKGVHSGDCLSRTS